MIHAKLVLGMAYGQCAVQAMSNEMLMKTTSRVQSMQSQLQDDNDAHSTRSQDGEVASSTSSRDRYQHRPFRVFIA